MNFSHNKKQFISLIKNKKNFIFYKKIDRLKSDPIPECIRIVEKNKYSFLYESVEKGKEKGQYSICGYKTLKTIQVKNNLKTKKSVKKNNKYSISDINFLDIDKEINKYKFKKNKNLPPMSGAFFGYIAYENIYNVEKINKFRKRNLINTPAVILFIPEILLIYDNINQSLFILKHFISEKNNDLDYEKHVNELNKIEVKINKRKKENFYDLNKIKSLKIKSNITKKTFINNVKKQEIHKRWRYIPGGAKSTI